MTAGAVARYGADGIAGTTEKVVGVVGGIAVGTHGAGMDSRGLLPPPSASTGSTSCGYAAVVETYSPWQGMWTRSMKTF